MKASASITREEGKLIALGRGCYGTQAG